MSKHYLTIVIISLIVIATTIYGFSKYGSPGEARGREIDQTRTSDLRNLQYAIENYYRQHNKLPDKLSEIEENSWTSHKDPQSKQEYEYISTNDTTYKLCANFSAASDTNNSYSYGYENFNHPKGQHCFDLKIQNTAISTGYKISKISDEKIDITSVTSDAKNITNFSNFPQGLFSDDPDQWGLVNYANESVTVTVKFTQPVKIKSISNIFSLCPDLKCYKWNAQGITAKQASLKLVDNADIATSITESSDGIESKRTVNSDEQFNEVRITVTRTDGVDRYVHWRKIKFEYK